MVDLPKWSDVNDKYSLGKKLDPLEQLIHAYEPTHGDNDLFRLTVSEAIKFCVDQELKDYINKLKNKTKQDRLMTEMAESLSRPRR